MLKENLHYNFLFLNCMFFIYMPSFFLWSWTEPSGPRSDQFGRSDQPDGDYLVWSPACRSSRASGKEVGTRPPVLPAPATGKNAPWILGWCSRRSPRKQVDDEDGTWRKKPGKLSAGIMLHLSFHVFCGGCCGATTQVDAIGKRVQTPEQAAVA